MLAEIVLSHGTRGEAKVKLDPKKVIPKKGDHLHVGGRHFEVLRVGHVFDGSLNDQKHSIEFEVKELT